MFAVYCQIFSKSRLIFLKLLRVSRVHTKHHGWQPPGKMANIENCQQIVRLVMMVMTYSASVLVNVEVGNMKEMLFSTWCNSGMASQAVTMGPLGIPRYLLTSHCTKIVIFDI